MPRATETIDWYDAPRLYDVVFAEDTELEAAFLEGVVARHGSSGGQRALEPACGTARLLVALARRGWRVSGFDLSPAMVSYGRRRLARFDGARLDVGDMAAPRAAGRHDLAFCLVGSFRYLLDEASARAHLAGIADALAPGGLYVLGLHLSEYAWQRRTRERFTGTRGSTEVVCTLHGWPPDRRRRTERLRASLRARERGRTRRLESDWLFRTYDARELERTLASEPRFEHVATYDFDFDLNAPRCLDDEQLDVVCVLRRRPDGPVRRTRRRKA